VKWQFTVLSFIDSSIVITESEGIKAASNQKDYKTESEIENVLGKGEKFIRFSLICLTRTALSKLIFNC